MNKPDNESRELRRLLRDLVALATTPAAWVGRDPAQIAESVADVLLHILRADGVYVCLHSPNRIEVVRNGQHPGFNEEVRTLLSNYRPGSLYVDSITAPEWPTPLKIAVQPIGISGEDGFVVIGSADAGFPSETENLLLSVGANQAAVALQTARLRAEADLERHRLRDLLSKAPAAIGLLTGSEHRWAYVNEEYVRLTGRNGPSDFLGKSVLESLPEIQGQGFIELLEEVFRTGKPYFGREMKADLTRSAKGLPDECYWDFVYQPVRDAAGQVEGILVHAVEVTDRVLARKSVEESERRYRDFAETATIALHWVGADGTILWANRAELDMLGYKAEEYIGHNITEFHVDPPVINDILSRLCRGEKLREYEARLRAKDGSTRQVVIDSSVLFENGKFVHTRCFTRDITTRKIAEEARRRLAAIVESSDEAIISKDLNGIVTSWNRQAERLFGYKEQEIIGRPILTIIPPELHRDEDMILSKIRSGEKIDHFETVRVAKSGEKIEVSISISPVRDENGEVVGAAKIARDIRENKKIERTLRTTEKLAAAGRLAATVAHEINNPLEAVANLIYLAKRDLPDAEKVASHLGSAKQELNRVAHITRQTLGFYRDTSSPVRFKIANTLDDLLSLYERRFETRNIRVIKRYDNDSDVIAFAGEIRQAFSNLLTNALDAMPSGGTLSLRVHKGRQWNSVHAPGVRIVIADSGSGISPEHRGNLFQPFFTTKADVGTGLGLWITRGILEKHGGSIRARSRTGEKHGTTFCMFLPGDSKQSQDHPHSTKFVENELVAGD